MLTHSRCFILTGAAVLLLAACASPRASTSPPASQLPTAASPDVVLRSYLDALVRGDCPTAQALTVPPFGFGNGELCGHTTVRSYAFDGPPATPSDTEVVFATTLDTTGTADGSIEAPVTDEDELKGYTQYTEAHYQMYQGDLSRLM